MGRVKRGSAEIVKEDSLTSHEEDFLAQEQEDSDEGQGSSSVSQGEGDSNAEDEREVEDEGDVNMQGSTEHDLSTITEEEKRTLLETQGPELVALLKDYDKSVTELKDRLIPVIERIKSGQAATSEGMSLLETKMHLLLFYVQNLTFYLLLKLNGQSVANHPVIMELVKIRTYLEKLKPIEKKLKYQIDKLVKAAMTGTVAEGAEAKRHRPMVDELVPLDQNEGAEDGDGTFKPSQLAPMFFEENKRVAREEREAARERSRMKQSEMMEILKDALGDAPEEIVPQGAGSGSQRLKRLREKVTAAERYEEENFLRMSLTKQERKERRELRNSANPDLDVEDFNDFEALLQSATSAADEKHAESEARDEAYSKILSDLKSSQRKRPTTDSMGPDVSLKELQKSKIQQLKEEKKLMKKAEKEAKRARASLGDADSTMPESVVDTKTKKRPRESVNGKADKHSKSKEKGSRKAVKHS